MGETENRVRQGLARHGEASPIAPHLRRYVECYLQTFLYEGRLDPRLRELAILRVAWRAKQPYEWANHYRIAQAAGVTDAEVLAARLPREERRLEGSAAFTLDAVDEMIDTDLLSEQTLGQAERIFGHADIAEEFIHLVGGYRAMAVLLNIKKPSLERAGLAFWPPDGVAP